MQKRIYWNDGWKFKETYENQMRETAYQDDAWEDVRLPHTCKETPFHYFDERSYQMVCCYRKHFFSPEEWKDQTVIVTFEGIAQGELKHPAVRVCDRLYDLRRNLPGSLCGSEK